jgi:hypothetical protein
VTKIHWSLLSPALVAFVTTPQTHASTRTHETGSESELKCPLLVQSNSLNPGWGPNIDKIYDRFSCIHESLPRESQETLLKKHLFPLLDICPEEKGKELATAAVHAQHRTKRLPQLDLSSKRRELSRLLDELERDAKRSFVKERSNLQEILQEIMDSLTNWINAIWSAVFEYRVDFSHAHDCLMFIANVLDRVDKSRGWYAF